MNELITKFVFDDVESNRRIDITEKRLVSLDSRLNSFGQNPTFGRGLSTYFDTLNKKVNQFESNLKNAGNADLKSLGNDLLKQAQIEKAIEQTKRTKVQTLAEEVKLERQKLGLQSDQLKLERQKQSLQPKQGSAKISPEVAAINAQTQKNAKQQADFRATLAKRVADTEIAEERRVDRFRRQTARDYAARILNRNGGSNGGGAGNSLRDVASTLGFGSLTGLGVAGGIGAAAYGLKQFVDLSQVAIEKSVASSRANRLLASSATEAGIAYGVLADKNKKYAELLGLSDVATSRTTAKIQQLATFSGKPQSFDKLSLGFADLGAAKGIDSRDLETLIGTILSGQDEGLNKLGISDPGQLYKAFAKEIGTTADKLTQFQKVQAAVNAVLDKSAIFKGTATARMNSLEGQTARTAAQFDNFTTSLSTSFTQSYTFNSILTETSKLMKQLTYDTDDLQKKFSKGVLTDKDISQAAAPSFVTAQGSSILKGFYSFMSGFSSLLGGGAVGAKLFPSVGQAGVNFAEAAVSQDPEYQQQLREDYLRRQLHAQIQLDAAQKKAAADQKKSLDEINAKEAKRQEILQKQVDLLDLFKNPRSSTSDISSQLQKLKNGNIFGASDSQISEAESKKLVEAGEQEISERTSRAYQRILQTETKNLNELRRGLANIKTDPNLFFEQRENLITSFEQKIKESVEQGKAKVIELGKLYTETFDSLSVRANSNNPFVSLFSEADKSLKNLRDNLKGLSPELQAVALQMEQKANSLKLFEARIDNNLSTFDLRERASDLRGSDRAPLKIEDPGKFFTDYIEFYSKKLETDFAKTTARYASESNFGGSVRVDQRPFTRFSRVSDTDGSFGGFSQTDARNDLLYSFDRVSGGLGGFSRRQKSFADLTEQEKRSFIDSSTKTEVDLSLNARLERQRAVIYDNAFSDDQKALADRKFLALASNVNPNELSGRNRETLALTAERQAARQEKAEADARALSEKDLKLKQQMVDELTKLREIAEKDGYGAIEQTLRVITTDGIEAELKPAATARDTQKAYNDGYKGGTFYEESQK